MGTYTTYAEIGARTWYSRRRRANGQHKHPHDDRETNAPPAKMQCPRCEQTYPFAGTCPACEITLVDRTRVLVAPKNADDTETPMASAPLLYAMGVAVLLPFVGIFAYEAVGPITAAASVGGVAGFGGAVERLNAWRRRSARKRRLAKRRETATQIPVSSTASLPAETYEPVRIVGKLRLDVVGSEARAWIEDGAAIAVLPLRGKLRFHRRDTLAEVDEVPADTEVEVIGLGRRISSGGKGYRLSEQTFTFDEGEVIDVWV
jgi:hypothetical protein